MDFFSNIVGWFQSIRWSRTDKIAAASLAVLLSIVVTCAGCTAIGNALGGGATQSNGAAIASNAAHATPTLSATDTPLPTFTPAPTATPVHPTVVYNVTSTVYQERTSAFTLRGSSQVVQWWCDPSSGSGGTYNVIILFYTAYGTNTFEGVNDMCEQGNTSGTKVLFMSPGAYKLDLFIQGWWHIKVTDMP